VFSNSLSLRLSSTSTRRRLAKFAKRFPVSAKSWALRIVAFRDEHGPFESANDLSRVPGINEKRLSVMSPRISVMPPNSGYRRAADEIANESLPPSPRFSIGSDAFPGSFAPSLDSLLPNGPEEMQHGVSLTSSPAPMDDELANIGASILSAPPSRRPTRSPKRAEAVVEDVDAFVQIPVDRPWRVWVILGALGMFSALGGAIAGVRSQDGGPRGKLEQRVGRAESHVIDVAGSVRALEGQTTTLADSINALDARLTDQERKANPAAKVRPFATVKTPEKRPPSPESRHDNEDTGARQRVRDALTQLDSALPATAK
jgi:hypothetical protein